MGWRFKGGGFVNGVPARDMTDEEMFALPAQLQVAAKRFFEPSDEIDSLPERRATPYSRILLVCPTLRLEQETIDRIHGQKWRGAIDFYFTRDNPFTGHQAYLNIELNMNKARKFFLKENYDAMFVVESDMLSPYDALERLAAIKADIAGGLYVMRRSSKATNAMVYDPSDSCNLTTIPLTELKKAELVRTNGVSMGCVLMSRDVLKKVQFHAELPLPPDSPFMCDCNKEGFKTVLDATIVCGHKTEEGKVLYPEM